MIIYHATPHDFDVLRSGSWVSILVGEAAVHLLMKNIQEGIPADEGWIISLDVPDNTYFETIAMIAPGCSNMTTSEDYHISTDQKLCLKNNLHLIPEYIGRLFHYDEFLI